jgi:hypothetical protein
MEGVRLFLGAFNTLMGFLSGGLIVICTVVLVFEVSCATG